MRVFVVGTGRCGSSTFYQACRHISNYTAGHETAAGSIQLPDYPDNHIEVDCQNTLKLGLLLDRYPDALFVHLIRERNACIKSLASQCPDEMMALGRIFCQTELTPMEGAEFWYDACRNLIWHMLRGKPLSGMRRNMMEFKLNVPGVHWLDFTEWIDAEGSLDGGFAEWSRRYNPAGNRGRDNWEAL